MITFNEINQDDDIGKINAVLDKRRHFLKQQYTGYNIQSKQFKLLDYIKVINLSFYYIMFGSDSISEELKLNEVFYLNGINIIFDNLYCDFTEAKYAPTFLTQNVGAIHSQIKFYGEIGILDVIKSFRKYKLTKYIGQSGNCLQFSFTHKYIGLENFEILEDIERGERVLEKQRYKRDNLNKVKDNIIEQMKKYVYPWHQHFIGYDTNGDIDAYYSHVAELYAEKTFDFDCFEDDDKFGGIPYIIYKKCALLIISFALKHIEYSNLLIKKFSNIELVNVLTINRDIDEIVDIFSDVCNIDNNEAKQVLDCFVLSYEKYDYYRINIDYLIMPYTVISKTQIVFSVIGALSGIYTFLLSELKRKFSKDWNKNISHREAQFRKDIYKLFDNELFIKIDRNLPIQYNGKILTDIDACIIEKATNQIAFFQLKWQEQYGNNIGRRQSRMENFIAETNKWINDIIGWLNNIDNRKLASMLGLKEKQVNISKVKLFVIGKHSVYFSGNDKLDDRADWALWLQIERLFNKDYAVFRSLNSLSKKLQEDNPYKKLPTQKKQLIHFEEIDIEVYPYDDET